MGKINNCFHKKSTFICTVVLFDNLTKNVSCIFTPSSEVVRKYTQELRKLTLKILELLCEGLGLNPEYFCGGLSENPVVSSHFYPPCPEPNLTLGTSKHKDPNLITILHQEEGINALQVFKDGEWIGVEPIPNAFVVNIGIMLQVFFFHLALVKLSILVY